MEDVGVGGAMGNKEGLRKEERGEGERVKIVVFGGGGIKEEG